MRIAAGEGGHHHLAAGIAVPAAAAAAVAATTSGGLCCACHRYPTETIVVCVRRSHPLALSATPCLLGHLCSADDMC
jgi:hypothetical protein